VVAAEATAAATTTAEAAAPALAHHEVETSFLLASATGLATDAAAETNAGEAVLTRLPLQK
jgi:hypothetical protein